MHPLENGMGVPAFLAKLWRLVEDSETNNLISWSSDGRSFIIQNQAKFAKELLPLNYKHNNMASFIRQLNMYGFHKITSIDNGGLKFEKDEMEFSHPYFQKGHPYLLEHIKRKIANPKQAESEKTVAKAETVTRVLNEVKNIRGRQDSLDTRFSAMKQENEALWREVAILRQKHLKQQQIVNKLIQFLVTIVQPQRSGLGSGIGKRRCQLMINDAPQTKLRRANEGPIISELTEELLDDVDSDLDDHPINISNVQSPGSQTSKGSSSFDQDFTMTSSIPEAFVDFITNNYGNNYCVADLDGASNGDGSVDGLGLDDIDEIDTNNMAIYSGAPIKKEPVTKSELNENKPIVVTEKLPEKSSQSPTIQSLLIQASNQQQQQQQQQQQLQQQQQQLQQEQEQQDVINADLMLNVLNDQPSAGTSQESIMTSQNLFQTPQQSQNNLLPDDLFNFNDKADENKSGDLSVTKFNPKRTNDIMRLNSVDDYQSHIDNVQTDLDSLKTLLSNDSYNMDTNQLLGNAVLPPYLPTGNFDVETINKLFGGDDLVGYELSPVNIEMGLFGDDKKDENQSASGAELMTYQPSPYNNNLDLNELLQNVGDVDTVQNN